jgi:hypothetical protein
MRSVADTLKAEQREALATLTPEARVRLALRLGRRDLDAFRLAQDPPLDPGEAARELQRRRQQGRLRSRCARELIG